MYVVFTIAPQSMSSLMVYGLIRFGTLGHACTASHDPMSISHRTNAVNVSYSAYVSANTCVNAPRVFVAVLLMWL